MRLPAAALAVCALALGACRTIPPYTDPTQSFGSGDGARGAPLELFTVDWWTRLVEPTMWEYGPRETATPAFDSETGLLVVGTRDGYLRALDSDGKEQWRYKTQGPFIAGALIHSGTVYAPGGDGTLYALDVRTGELRWKYATGEELATVPVLAGGKLLVASQNDTLYAVDAKTGKWVWQYRRDPPAGFTIRGVSTPTVRDGTVFVGFSDGTISALDLNDGVAKWERTLSTGTLAGAFLDVDTQPVFDESGRLFAASYKDGVFALDPATGDVTWQSATGGLTSLLTKGEVLFGAGDAQVGAFLADTGRRLWSLELGSKAGRTPVLVKGLLVVPVTSSLLFVDPSSGQAKTAWDPGEGVSAAPRMDGRRLYVLSNNGVLYALTVTGAGG